MAMKTNAVSPEMAALERIRREKARRHLVDFGRYLFDWWTPAPVHDLICAALEEVYAYIESGGEKGTGSLIIEMPPQHGKTTMVSQMLPAWLLGKRPDSRVVLTAYGADLAGENSRTVRNIMIGERFGAVFGVKSALDAPVTMSDDSTARANWNLAEPNRGGVLAVGVGGGLTGRPADLIVIDDPFKNREEAENHLERKKKLRWMTSSVLSRTRKGTAIVIIHTRWHREDLIGEMIKSTQTNVRARQWKVVSLPAIPLEPREYAGNLIEQMTAALQGLYKPFEDPLGREPGSCQVLWEAEFPWPVLERIKNTLETTGQIGDWHALYQQQPRPSEGAFFGSADFGIVERAPDKLKWCRYVDLAISERKTADYNATAAVALADDGTLYVRDMLREHGWENFAEMMKAAMLSDLERGTIWGLEDVNFQALAFQEMIKDRSLAAIPILAVVPKGDKVQRARPVQTRAKIGKVKLVRGPWNQAFLLEALDFPTGAHDDQVDTVSGGLQMIADGANGWMDFAAEELAEAKKQEGDEACSTNS